jgi:HK97 gp10 family phage protein
MRVRSKITGFEEISIGLRHIADKVKDGARKQMHRSADKIVKEAQLNAPFDTGALEKSIHKEISYETRGRLRITIVAGGEVDGVDVDAYVVMIHEHYDEMRPGEGTRLKMQANPGRLIGDHFLTRAYDAQENKLQKAMIGMVSLLGNVKVGTSLPNIDVETGEE